MKTSITEKEKLQLLGLLTLGIKHHQIVDHVEQAMADLTETEVGGLLGDALYESNLDIDTVLANMDIKVVEE